MGFYRHCEDQVRAADKDRFHITMGTAFLERIAELSSAALARLHA